MRLVTGIFRLPAGPVERARPAMERMIASSRAEAGCRAYAYAIDVTDPGLVRVHELWRDAAALRRHPYSVHLAEWRSAWGDLEIQDRDLVAREVSDPDPV